MNSCDTVIVGAGPGGLTAAALLAAAGQRVVLLEQHHRIGPKVCAGGITWAGIRNYIPEHLIEKVFPEQHVSSARQQVVLRESHPIVVTIDRERLGQWMLEQAIKAGAQVFAGTRVTGIKDSTVETTCGTFAGRWLIGADGSNSLVRRSLKIPRKIVGIGLQYWLKGDFPHMEWHLDAKRFAGGYTWLFPHQDRASAGIYAGSSRCSALQIQNFLTEWMKGKGLPINEGRPEAFQVNYDFRGWHFGSTFLVGDAAGLASGFTGEGIVPAILSGQAAAKTILNPDHTDYAMIRLLNKHRHHARMQRIAATKPRLGQVLIETILTGLRYGFLDFSFLEMGA